IDSTSLAGRTCVLITGMVQVVPGTHIRLTGIRPSALAWPATSRRAARPADGGILWHDRPDRQPRTGAGCPAKQGRGRGTSPAGPPGTGDGPGDGRPHPASRAAITPMVGPPGTAHTPEVTQ